jgi:tetratricopeptide (TPR) repeat protein
MFVQAENQITSLPYVTSLPEWLQILVTTSARVILWMVHSFIPLNTSIIYSHNQVYGYIGQGIFLYPVILLFLFWYAWKLRRQHGYFLAGLVFYFVTLSPVLAIPESGQAIFMSDRYTYIPSIGLFFSFIVLVTKYFKNAVSQYILLGAFSLFFFIESFRIVGNWKNSETLFTRALQVYPESGLAHLNLGLYYRQMKDYDRALQTYSDGINYSRGYLQLYINRSRILLDRGQADLALQDLNYCLSKNPNLVNALTNRGVAYGMKEKLDSALADLTQALKMQPGDADILANRGLVFFKQGKYAEAAKDLHMYLEKVPDDADNLNLLGLAYLNGGETEQALKAINRSIEFKSGEAAFYYNRSIVYRRMGERKMELADLLKASSLGYQVDPDYIRKLQQ